MLVQDEAVLGGFRLAQGLHYNEYSHSSGEYVVNPLLEVLEIEALSADLSSVFEYDEIADAADDRSADDTYLEDADNVYAAF